ncbi:MAG: hypothetical protein DLM62_11765 [Pseudonocardiales bacterium]|nr:MAG: hypothetical protein DLM62_11765 [Pseudonocardiales bacterium]
MPNESPTDGAPEPANPFPPAFRWETSTQEAPTQVIGAVGHATALRDPSRDEPREDSAPPWAELEPPPIAEQQSDWLRLGPEAFQSPAPQSRSKQIIGIAVLAVVVLGLAGAAVAYFLAGGSSNRSGQITAPPATTAPRVQPVLPSVAPAAPPVTAATPATAPAVTAPAPEASGNPEPSVTPAAPPPAGLVPSPPLHRSAAASTQGRTTAAAPHTASRPPAEEPPPPPAPTSAPEGFTRVPSKPWNPQPPQ